MSKDSFRHLVSYESSDTIPGDPTNPYTDRYVETKGGAEALRKLDWSRVVAHSECVRLARSLFEDIANPLGVPHPFPGQGHPATSDFRNARVLRNR